MQALADELRRQDPDRYLSTLYAPAEKRSDLAALYAFNAAIASIRDQVREPGLGEIRLQWWENALMARADAAGHPVAVALGRAIERHNLPIEAFRNMLEARRFDLYCDPMPTVTDLEGYCGETAGAVIQLASLVLDADAARQSGVTAGHGGCAQAICGMLSLLPRHRARQQSFIPVKLLAAAGAEPSDLFAAEPGKAAQRAVAAMVALARQHMSEFERKAAEIPSILLPAYLPLGIVRPWLRRIEKAGPSIFQHSVQLSPLRRHVAMIRRAATGWR